MYTAHPYSGGTHEYYIMSSGRCFIMNIITGIQDILLLSLSLSSIGVKHSKTVYLCPEIEMLVLKKTKLIEII